MNIGILRCLKIIELVEFIRPYCMEQVTTILEE